MVSEFSLHTFLFLCLVAVSNGGCMGAEETMFTKVLPDGATVVAVKVEQFIDGEKPDPNLQSQAALHGLNITAFQGRAETCAVFLSENEKNRRRLLRTYIIRALDRTEFIDGTEASPLPGFCLYDVAKFEDKLLVLLLKADAIHLDAIPIAETAKQASPAANWVVIFDRYWARRKEGFLPIARAQIIPMKDGAHVFCVSKSGKCMLWEVRDKKAALVWTKTEGAIPEDAAPPQKQPAERKP